MTLALSLVLAALTLPRADVHGQEVLRIAAVVNDEVIPRSCGDRSPLRSCAP